METQGFFSRQDMGGFPDGQILEELRKATLKQKTRNMTSVKAKFTCNSVISNPWGTSKVATFHAVYDSKGENADFSKATPAGSLSLVIDNETPAVEYFEQGKNYYLTFEVADEN